MIQWLAPFDFVSVFSIQPFCVLFVFSWIPVIPNQDLNIYHQFLAGLTIDHGISYHVPKIPILGTPAPEIAQPQKMCTANFSSGTLKTLINLPLMLKNKIFWRRPAEILGYSRTFFLVAWPFLHQSPWNLAPELKLILPATKFNKKIILTNPSHINDPPILPPK